MRNFVAVLFPERLAVLVKRAVIALRCTYPEEKETVYSLELRMTGRVRYAVRRDLILANGLRTVLYQLEETPNPQDKPMPAK